VKTATSAVVDEGAEEAMACAARGELVLVLVLVRLRVARSAYLCSGGGERWVAVALLVGVDRGGGRAISSPPFARYGEPCLQVYCTFATFTIARARWRG
jgi:hypothetical protein